MPANNGSCTQIGVEQVALSLWKCFETFHTSGTDSLNNVFVCIFISTRMRGSMCDWIIWPWGGEKKNVLLQRYVLYHLGLLTDLLLNSTTISIALLMTLLLLLLLLLLLFVRTHIKKSQDWSFKCTSWTSTSKSLVINSANSKTGLKVWTRRFIAVPQKALLEIL